MPPLSPNQRTALALFQAHVLGTADTPGCVQCQRGGVTLDPADGCAEGRRLAACIADGRDPNEQTD
jgi:hypothetical protein